LSLLSVSTLKITLHILHSRHVFSPVSVSHQANSQLHKAAGAGAVLHYLVQNGLRQVKEAFFDVDVRFCTRLKERDSVLSSNLTMTHIHTHL